MAIRSETPSVISRPQGATMKLRVDLPTDPLESALLRKAFQNLQERVDLLQKHLDMERVRATEALAEADRLRVSLQAMVEASMAVATTYGAAQLQAESLHDEAGELLAWFACQDHQTAPGIDCEVCSRLALLRQRLQDFKSCFKDFQD